MARWVGWKFSDSANVLTICLENKTYCACGDYVKAPFEPELKAFVTLEISKHDAVTGEDLRE